MCSGIELYYIYFLFKKKLISELLRWILILKNIQNIEISNLLSYLIFYLINF